MRGLIANAHDIDMNGPALPRLFQKIGAELIAAVVLIGSVLIALMWPERGRFEALTHSDLSVILPLSLSMTLKLLGALVAMLGVVAAADYLFQHRQWHERQRMSLRELKEDSNRPKATRQRGR